VDQEDTEIDPDAEEYLPPLAGPEDELKGPYRFAQFGPKRWCVIDLETGKRVNEIPMEKAAAKAMVRRLNQIDRPRKDI